MRLSPLVLSLLLLACDGGGTPAVHGYAPAGFGPQISWDLNAEPLPELPLPNDVATWPDRSSRTGRRINVSLVAPTDFETGTREEFNRVDGWGTYSAISIPFDAHLDLVNILQRQGSSSEAFRASRFADHAVYVINLETGQPVPLEVNHGNIQFVLDNTNQYFANDPRASESNLLFETVNEDSNANGVLDPGEDTDFDGILDQPNTIDGRLGGVDDMAWFYERETKTLLLRPILPLEPKTEYAVVVTDRLLGLGGNPVRSPFEGRHHVTQYNQLQPLAGILSSNRELYGDLADRGWDGVAFAWTFTTQSVTDDLDAIRAGLYGQGTLDFLAEDFPPVYSPAPMRGGNGCDVTPANEISAPAENFLPIMESLLAIAFNISGPTANVVLESLSSLSHIAVINFDSPYFLGDPLNVGLEDNFNVDSFNGEAEVGRETLTMTLFIPKETETARQPFDTAFYVHGYGSANAEPLPFVGYMLRNGVAGIVLNAEGHGVPLPPALLAVARPIAEAECLGPMLNGILAGRAEDIDGDGTPDSGVDFWTAYVFHTRDVVRQSIIDHMRAIQILDTFDGREATPAEFPNSPIAVLERAQGSENPEQVYDANRFDYAGLDVAGDFDGNGVPDVGGPNSQILFTGGSLGGIVTGIMAGAEPRVTSAAPIVGAGGLTDVGVRSENGGVLRAMHLRMMGPFVMTGPRNERGDDRSSCAEGEVSMYFYASDRNTAAEIEFACLSEEVTGPDDVIRVGNYVNGEVRCAGATGGQAGRFRVPFPADQGDLLYVEIVPGGASHVDYADCSFSEPLDSIVIDTFQVGADACDRCGKYQQISWETGHPLVSPAMGFGHRRQSANLRRLLFLAQVGLEPADPINYARRAFLDPVGGPTNLFVINSIGDQNVPISAGNAYARAAGVLPFLPPDAPDYLADWRAPADFSEMYPGYTNPNDLLIGQYIFEGVERLERHPQENGPNNYLMDIDDVAEGAYRFRPDGRHQSNEEDAVSVYPRYPRPLRWVRRSESVASGDDVWDPVIGQNISGLLNHYVIPAGVHGFDEIVYDQSLPWDPAQYLINLVSRYGATGGTDIRYITDPDGHTCLENSTCDFLQ